jgi:lysophospholipase L1-like esterase/chitodextrinase
MSIINQIRRQGRLVWQALLDLIIPSQPLILNPLNITTTTVDLVWNDSLDNVGISTYKIYNNGDFLIDTLSNTPYYTITGLTPSTSYNLTIKAFDTSNNESIASNLVSFVTLAETDTTAPTNPSSFVASSIGETDCALTWTASTDAVGVVDYRIYNNGVLFLNSVGGAVTSYNLSGLQPDTEYVLTIRAIDAAGNESGNSNSQSFTTDAASGTPIVRARINVGGSGIIATDGDMDWASNASTGATSGTGYSVNTGNVYNSSAVTWTRHSSIPSSIPNADFQAIYDTERWDDSASPEMKFTFPDLPNGEYEVRLYCGENGAGTTTRVFDVVIQEIEEGSNVNVVTLFGGSQVAGMIPYSGITVDDGTLTIEFLHVSENPQVNAIEIVQTDATPPAEFEVTSQTEVDDFETLNGALSSPERYAHDYIVSYLKFHDIWDDLNDVSTMLNSNYYKLKNSVARDNIQSGNSGINLNTYSINNISVTLDYNYVPSGDVELLNSGTQLKFTYTLGGDPYKAITVGSSVQRLPHSLYFNTKRTLIINSGASNLTLATKYGWELKANNTSNTGTFSSNTLQVADPSKLNFFAVGISLTQEKAELLALGIKEFNDLMSRTNYDAEFDTYNFVGNSITWGYEPPGTKILSNYPKLVGDELGLNNTNSNLANMGVSGIELSQVLAEIQSDDYYGLLKPNLNVDNYVIVSLGTNDFLKTPLPTAAQVKNDLDTYTALLTAAGNKVLVILPHRSTTYALDSPSNYNSQVPTFIGLVEADADYNNGSNAFSTMVFETGNATYDNTTNTTYWYDGLHPKAAYFTLMAPIIAAKFQTDTTAPTAPTSLTSSNVTDISVDLSWTASTDAVGVVNYKLYNSGTFIKNIGNFTSTTATGLTASTAYAFTVKALDLAGNESTASNTVNITTSATTGYDPTDDLFGELGYLGATLCPYSQRANLQTYLNTHNEVKLEAGDYQNGGASFITLSGDMKLYGHPSKNIVPPIRIAAGSNGVVVNSVKVWYGCTFLGGSITTNCTISSVSGGYINGTNVQLVDNDFIDIVGGTVQFDNSSSGYLRNNRFIKQWTSTAFPQLKLKGNSTTPSYGNNWAWINFLTPHGSPTDISGIEDINFVGLDAEAWNYTATTPSNALLYMRNMGSVKLGSLNGYGYATVSSPVFDIQANDLFILDKQIYTTGGASTTTAKTFIAHSNGEAYSVTGGNYDARGHFNSTNFSYNGSNQTSLITGTTATNIISSLLGTEYTPWARPTFQILPNPTGATWATDRIGQSSDRAYIQGLIDTNKFAELPAGVYYINAPLLINKDEGIIGAGTGKTAIVGITDDFNLINVRGTGNGSFTVAHLTLQGGAKGIHITSDGYDVWFQPNGIDVKYLVLRNQATYGIEVAQMYGMDNNMFINVNFVNIPIGFKQTPDPAYTSGETNHMTYIDKTVFYQCQAFNCGTAYSLKTGRADNLNAWIDCNFDGNGIAIDLLANNAPIVVNSDFKNHTGSYILGSNAALGLYNCDFSGNSTTNIIKGTNTDIEGCNFLDNIPLFSSGFTATGYIVNSTLVGTYGTMPNGMFINSNMQSNAEVNYLLVNRVGGSNTVLLDATPDPYPQLLVKH